ncbi:MAG TPA: tRNA (adenosine(37)-N6)-threonylcarbamoyltransferase complex ATPase subunit type 1 TsaE [Steroidobacteraceae bacterium]|nr:tRNA (adenosine(37)-N6)-threonylcarbamoyltransferase complex ATPase subunit type 1 TsaE [Steroidobacteraceae bacterium]
MADIEPEMALALPDSEATALLGTALAGGFPGAGESSAALYLEGDLGAGKTTCARALLRALGVRGLIRSPTYTLVETYRLEGRQPSLTGVHVDLYRLAGAAAVDELGLRDFMAPGHLFLIEWPDRGAGALPGADLELTLELAPPGRLARLRARSERGSMWLRNLRSDTRLGSYLYNLT